MAASAALPVAMDTIAADGTQDSGAVATDAATIARASLAGELPVVPPVPSGCGWSEQSWFTWQAEHLMDRGDLNGAAKLYKHVVCRPGIGAEHRFVPALVGYRAYLLVRPLQTHVEPQAVFEAVVAATPLQRVAARDYLELAQRVPADERPSFHSYVAGKIYEYTFDNPAQAYHHYCQQPHNVFAMTAKAHALERGEGVRQDLPLALKLYEQAAEMGYAQAQYNVGNCLYNGEGGESDLTRAVRFFKMAAKQGFIDAHINLGMSLWNDAGIARDMKRCADHYRLGAEAGDEESQYWLGILYETGQGVDRNHDLARYWYQRAADQGMIQAQERLGAPSWDDGIPASLDFSSDDDMPDW